MPEIVTGKVSVSVPVAGAGVIVNVKTSSLHVPVSLPLVLRAAVIVGAVSPPDPVDAVAVGVAPNSTSSPLVQLFAVAPVGKTVKVTVLFPEVQSFTRSKVTFDADWSFTPARMVGAVEGEAIPKVFTPLVTAAAGPTPSTAAPPSPSSPAATTAKHRRALNNVVFTTLLAFFTRAGCTDRIDGSTKQHGLWPHYVAYPAMGVNETL
jgi:hypothetical protein